METTRPRPRGVVRVQAWGRLIYSDPPGKSSSQRACGSVAGVHTTPPPARITAQASGSTLAQTTRSLIPRAAEAAAFPATARLRRWSGTLGEKPWGIAPTGPRKKGISRGTPGQGSKRPGLRNPAGRRISQAAPYILRHLFPVRPSPGYSRPGKGSGAGISRARNMGSGSPGGGEGGRSPVTMHPTAV